MNWGIAFFSLAVIAIYSFHQILRQMIIANAFRATEELNLTEIRAILSDIKITIGFWHREQ